MYRQSRRTTSSQWTVLIGRFLPGPAGWGGGSGGHPSPSPVVSRRRAGGKFGRRRAESEGQGIPDNRAQMGPSPPPFDGRARPACPGCPAPYLEASTTGGRGPAPQPGAYAQSGSSTSTHHHGEAPSSSTSKASRRVIASGERESVCPPAGPRLLETRPAPRGGVMVWLGVDWGGPLRGRDVVALHVALAVVEGQIHKRAHAVLRAATHLHRAGRVLGPGADLPWTITSPSATAPSTMRHPRTTGCSGCCRDIIT